MMEEITHLTLFELKVDITQSFEMTKPTLNVPNSVEIFSHKSPIQISEAFNLIGAYGDPVSISALLTAFFETQINVEESPRKIKLLYSNSQSKAAMVYANNQDFQYKEKAIKSSNSVILFVRYLFDCCPKVYVCLSEYHLANWYYSKEPRLANPFVKKQHKIVKGKIKKEESKGSEFLKLKSSLRVAPQDLN